MANSGAKILSSGEPPSRFTKLREWIIKNFFRSLEAVTHKNERYLKEHIRKAMTPSAFRPYFCRLWSRFRYPVSLPEDIAHDLGLSLSNALPFEEFMRFLASPQCISQKLYKHMSRSEAEHKFHAALQKEFFPHCTFYSYCFTKGWLVVALYFDMHSRLRRVYVQCPTDYCVDGFEMKLLGEKWTQ